MLSDSTLVESVKRGQSSAFSQLVSRYQHVAMAIALRTVKDRHLAEDVVQESFLLAYQHLKSLTNGSKFGPWLMRITRRQAIRVEQFRT